MISFLQLHSTMRLSLTRRWEVFQWPRKEFTLLSETKELVFHSWPSRSTTLHALRSLPALLISRVHRLDENWLQLNRLKVCWDWEFRIICKSSCFSSKLAFTMLTLLFLKYTGKCVANSVETSPPRHLCKGDGKWYLLSGGCQCKPGYEADHPRQTCNGRFEYFIMLFWAERS